LDTTCLDHTVILLTTMRTYLILSALFVCSYFVLGCGGGSSGGDSISGNWTGQLFQSSGISCSDGTFLGAGVGTPTRTITLLVTGGEAVGDAASVSFDACTLTGTRDSAASIEFSSSSQSCPKKLLFSEIDDGLAKLSIDPGSPRTSADGTVGCVIAESGEIRQEG
jgi:hypothetical protein